MTKPNFFIVGTPKSGTTSLFNYLEEHPEVFVPTIKEPHYFSYPEVATTYYKTTIVSEEEKYLNLYKGAKNYKAIGDFSSSYLFNDKSAKRIKALNPKAKIVIVLRNPTQRAVSHYMMDYSQGYIDSSLLDVLENKEKHNKYYSQYVEVGEYGPQLERYYKQFPKDQLLILKSDDLFDETARTVEQIFQFLRVDSNFKPNFEVKYNQFKEPRFKLIRRLKNSRFINWVFDHLPGGLKKMATKVAFDANKEKPEFEEEKIILNAHYLSHIVETEKLIGKELSSWKDNM